MAVTHYWYGAAFVNVFTRQFNIDWDTNAIKTLLTTACYTPNQDTHNDHADITNEVACGCGYTTGGATLACKTNAYSPNTFTLDAANVSWACSTITARRAVIYDDSAAMSGCKGLLTWVDFGQNESSSSGTFAINWSCCGIATVTPANAACFP